MYTLFLADDEPWIVEGLKASISWAEEGFELCGCAFNGPEAERMLTTLRPDLALIDIRMPGLSGLEVIRRVKNVCSDTRFVIVSGYAEFEYAQEGIELSVAGYLLKPVDEKKLLEVARAVRASLDAERGPNVDAAISDRDATAEVLSPGQFIRLHCCEGIAFSDLCHRFNMSATAMRQQLAREIRMPFIQYLAELRMRRAAQLLLETAMSVNEIASSCGYEDPLYFRKVFKRFYGETPSEYRENSVAEEVSKGNNR